MGKPHVHAHAHVHVHAHVLMDVSTRAQTDGYCSARGTDEQAVDKEGSTCVAPDYFLLTTDSSLLTAHVAPRRRQ